MERLHTWGRAYVIEESLNPFDISNLDSTDGGTRLEFEVVETIGHMGIDKDILISTSLFSKKDEMWKGEWNFEDFKKSIECESQDKYWNPLQKRRERYPENACHRIYIDPNLRGMARHLINECGFDEVYVMAERSDGFKSGMMWRYLPILDNRWKWVVCTGIDRYDSKGIYENEISIPDKCATASVWMNRHWMPFAGPFACNPLWMQKIYGVNSDCSQYLSGFLNVWESLGKQDARVRNVLKGTKNRGDALPWIDAGFLWMAFWNRKFMEDDPGLTTRSMQRYGGINITPFMIGGIEQLKK